MNYPPHQAGGARNRAMILAQIIPALLICQGIWEAFSPLVVKSLFLWQKIFLVAVNPFENQ
jgi:hypothetical protein